MLKAEGARTSAILRAEGEAKAIETVFQAIHDGGPDQPLLSYQYLQMLPQLAQGDANKIFVIPSEFSQALGGLAERLTSSNGPLPPPPAPTGDDGGDSAASTALEEARAAAKAAEREAGRAEQATPTAPDAPGVIPPPPPAS